MRETLADRCWAEINLAALRHNAQVLRKLAGEGAQLIAVVKANAYGHGLAEVSRALTQEAQAFGVANLEEALEVRRNVPEAAVLVLGPVLPEERAAVIARGFVASISRLEEATDFATSATERPAQLNFDIDTGMGRMGAPEQSAIDTARRLFKLRGAVIHSVSTHLPVADEDAAFTRAELARFGEIITQLRREAPVRFLAHALPSAGVLAFGEAAYDCVRAGLALYGVSPIPRLQHLLRPALSLKTRIVLVRDVPRGTTIGYGRTFTTPKAMRVATLAVGYADGYMRALSNSGATVLMKGKRCAVLGRISMDLTVVDVSEIPNPAAGDTAILIGRDGNQEVLAAELAARAGTIAWEVFTGIGGRVRRVYV
jgi:alanine racemase